MTPTLGYWDIRGLAEPIRYLLHYKGQEFEDKRYTTFDAWQNDKYKLGLDFPNLPYYIDDSVSLTQSTAILRYLARKHGLDGGTEEKTRVELVEQQIIDFGHSLAKICYSPEFEKLKGDFVKGVVPSQLKLFSAFLGNRRWFAGDSITYVDFMAYDIFDFYDILIPNVLKDFPNLKGYFKRFESLPELQTYMKSTTYRRWPIFTPAAYFGGKGPEPKR